MVARLGVLNLPLGLNSREFIDAVSGRFPSKADAHALDVGGIAGRVEVPAIFNKVLRNLPSPRQTGFAGSEKFTLELIATEEREASPSEEDPRLTLAVEDVSPESLLRHSASSRLTSAVRTFLRRQSGSTPRLSR